MTALLRTLLLPLAVVADAFASLVLGERECCCGPDTRPGTVTVTADPQRTAESIRKAVERR